MKAITLNKFGPNVDLKMAEVAKPALGTNEVLVKVHAAGMNPLDVKIRNGSSFLCQALTKVLPWVPGFDFSGVIEEVDESIKDFQVGMPVFGFTEFLSGGSFAEYVRVPVNRIAIKPSGVSFEEAAALPIAALTAWQALFENGQIQPKQKVLIHAAAGGVGHFAVQFAQNHGAQVIGTTSAVHADLMKKLGVENWLDYTKSSFEKLKDIDCVIDNVGHETGFKSLTVIQDQGVVVTIPTITADSILKRAEELGKNAKAFVVHIDTVKLAHIAALVEARQIKVHLDAVYPLEQAQLAYEKIASGHTEGKTVVQISP